MKHAVFVLRYTSKKALSSVFHLYKKVYCISNFFMKHAVFVLRYTSKKALSSVFHLYKKVYCISLNFVTAIICTYLLPNNQFLIEKKLSQTSESQVLVELPSSPLWLQNAISVPANEI